MLLRSEVEMVHSQTKSFLNWGNKIYFYYRLLTFCYFSVRHFQVICGNFDVLD